MCEHSEKEWNEVREQLRDARLLAEVRRQALCAEVGEKQEWCRAAREIGIRLFGHVPDDYAAMGPASWLAWARGALEARDVLLRRIDTALKQAQADAVFGVVDDAARGEDAEAIAMWQQLPLTF